MDISQINQIAITYYKDVYWHCMHKVNYDDSLASDLVQDVFLLLQEKYKGLPADVNMKRWLFTAANNKLKEKQRKKQLQGQVISIDETAMPIADAVDFVKELENRITDEEIEHKKADVLQQLSTKDQELYKQYYVEQKSFVEIADEHATSVKTVRMRILRLRERITRIIELSITLLINSL